jgi:DNA-3-methyladenine glycosylase I
MFRCPWAADDLMIVYHDQEWGKPLHDDYKLFEFLILEGAQAGLSWNTILKKRQAYQQAFKEFDPVKVSKFSNSDIEQLVGNANIIRNRRKIESAINNAKIFLDIQKEFGSFDKYIWNFVDGKPINNQFKTMSEIPAETELSKQISNDLKKRGMSFIGPTIMYAFMEAIGMVNDHVIDCFRYKEIILNGEQENE